MTGSFEHIGPARPNWPVIISVPHAGRSYPANLQEDCRFPPEQLRILEDRYVDLLVKTAQLEGFSRLIAHTPRALIDLNRAEQDIDPAMLTAPLGPAPFLSAKARGGLGLIPSRTSNLGDIWRRRFTPDEVRSRIAVHYRPYHKALADILEEARTVFGGAILLDVHSMPPLPPTREGPSPDIVIGDRFGRSADHLFSQHAARCAQAAGLKTAFNKPYAGGHILDRHAAPDRNIHGLQIEIDRRLYLDSHMAEPGPQLPQIAQVVADIAHHLADALFAKDVPLAAE